MMLQAQAATAAADWLKVAQDLGVIGALLIACVVLLRALAKKDELIQAKDEQLVAVYKQTIERLTDALKGKQP